MREQSYAAAFDVRFHLTDAASGILRRAERIDKFFTLGLGVGSRLARFTAKSAGA